MNWRCWFGHDWRYFKLGMYPARQCVRCGKAQEQWYDFLDIVWKDIRHDD